MKNKKKFTAILITYNHKKYIEKAIESVLNQKTNFDFKIHIFDDASTDGSSEIVRKYAKKYPNKIIPFIAKTNVGVVENVFKAISKVDTEYYSVLETDDFWCDENKIQKQVDILDANQDCSFCGHNTLVKNSDGKERILFKKYSYNICEKYKFPKKFNKREFVKVHPSSRVYRTSAIDLKNLRMKDTIVWDSSSYWYFLSKGKLFYIDEIMSVYNYTGYGIYSGIDEIKQAKMALKNIFNINKEFDYKRNKVFYPLIMRYNKFLKLSIKERFILKYFPKQYKNKSEYFIDKVNEINLTGIDDKKVGIIGFHFSSFNYGALMVPYAMQSILSKIGYKPEIINYIPKGFEKENSKKSNSVFNNFRKKYLNLTDSYFNEKDIKKLNNHFNSFITGSDQVFIRVSDHKYFLNWVFGKKRILSYAASFGKKDLSRFSKQEINGIGELLKRFDGVSVREDSGVDICKENFNIKAIQNIDPTLLLEAEDYEKIIKNDKNIKPIEEDYIAYMFLGDIDLKKFSDSTDLKLLDAIKDKKNNRSFGEWLSLIKNAKYVITDSFHGLCFSLIFKKQFVIINREAGGTARIDSIFKLLGINPKRFINDSSQFYENLLKEKLDYAKIDMKIKAERQRSIQILKENLSAPKINKLEVVSKSNEPEKRKYKVYLFGIIPLLKVKSKNYNKNKIYLFGFLPIINSKSKSKKTKVYLFKIIPLLKIKSK